MIVFIKDNISDYGNFNNSTGKVYSCKLEECINFEEQIYREIIFENNTLSHTEDVIYITINNERIEYDSIQDKVIIFVDYVELAHYLINNNADFAENIVNIYNMFNQ